MPTYGGVSVPSFTATSERDIHFSFVFQLLLGLILCADSLPARYFDVKVIGSDGSQHGSHHVSSSYWSPRVVFLVPVRKVFHSINPFTAIGRLADRAIEREKAYPSPLSNARTLFPPRCRTYVRGAAIRQRGERAALPLRPISPPSLGVGPYFLAETLSSSPRRVDRRFLARARHAMKKFTPGGGGGASSSP